MLAGRKVTNVAISKLKLAKFNPSTRQADISGLVKSIEKVGLLVPITITKVFEVADGHRRIAAFKKLGWNEIPAIVAAGSLPEIFAEVNGSVKRLTGNETLQVYVKEPNAVSAKVRAAVEELEGVAGRTMVERMAANNFTLGTWHTAKRIAKEADVNSDTETLKILRWLMKYRCARTAGRALQLGTPPSKIMAAVRNSKPIKLTFVS
jgi:hypothetical protein